MTPKEKARDLVEKMNNNINDNVIIQYNDIPLWKDTLKQNALIAVDEIMKAIGWNEMELGVDRDNYWQKVKQEIEKL